LLAPGRITTTVIEMDATDAGARPQGGFDTKGQKRSLELERSADAESDRFETTVLGVQNPLRQEPS